MMLQNESLQTATVIAACRRASGRPRRVVFIESAAAMGGVQFSTLSLAQRLDRARWDPLVVCPEEGDLPQACRRAEVRVHIERRPPLRFTSIPLSNGRRLPNPLAWGWDAAVSLAAARNLTRFLAHERPDVVVTKGLFSHLYGGLAARKAKIPCLWHLQDFISERLWGIYRRALGQVARRVPAGIVVDGASIARQLPCEVQGKVVVVHNGVDTDAFRPGADGAAIRRDLGIPPDAPVIGNVARMTAWKGQHYLLEAFAGIAPGAPQARLLLVGSPVFDDDAYERQLRDRAVELELGDRVIFTGYRRDLAQVLAAMDTFVHSSLEKDTTPLSLLSAMSAGLPIVAFDIEGVREVVETREQGLLVPMGQVEPLGQALLRVLGDDRLRGRLAAGARRRVEEAFSLERHVSGMEESFSAVLQYQ